MMNGMKAGFDRISINLESALQVKPISLPIALLLAAATATEVRITIVDAIPVASGYTFKTGSILSDVSWMDIPSNSSNANNTQWFSRPTWGNRGTVYQPFLNAQHRKPTQLPAS